VGEITTDIGPVGRSVVLSVRFVVENVEWSKSWYCSPSPESSKSEKEVLDAPPADGQIAQTSGSANDECVDAIVRIGTILPGRTKTGISLIAHSAESTAPPAAGTGVPFHESHEGLPEPRSGSQISFLAVPFPAEALPFPSAPAVVIGATRISALPNINWPRWYKYAMSSFGQW
jgi:hypothetical protein